jgi:hypothetical protein
VIGAAKHGDMGAIGAILMGMVSNIGVLVIAWLALGSIVETLSLPPAQHGGRGQLYLVVPQGGGDATPDALPGLAFGLVACVLVGAFVGGAVSAELAKARPILIGMMSCSPLAVAMVPFGGALLGDDGLSWLAAGASPVMAGLGALVARGGWIGRVE